MSDDIVARLRAVLHNDRSVELMNREAADEIERLRRELGQVSDADSWVSKADAAHLDSLLNWCEFNDMESHRALQRLVNDRARLRGELRAEREKVKHQHEVALQMGRNMLAQMQAIDQLRSELSSIDTLVQALQNGKGATND